jgi:ubiquinol-cytochrome c reductase cytochrome b subunit
VIVRRFVDFLDDRLGSASFTKHALKKVFPDHWSFMLGEIAMYAFIALVLSGTFVAFLFDDSDKHVTYLGSYTPLLGRSVPASYASVLKISFGTHLGLFVRQFHHWAALVFTAAIIFHMCRIFFTAAYRKPREMNWIIGLTLLLLAMADGFTGYSLPGDLLSGAGLRIAYSVAESIPVVGSWLAFIYFGGKFPTSVMTSRLFITHVLLVPLLIIGALSLHLGMVWRQKHSQFVGPGRTEHNVVGSKLWPGYALKSVGLMFAVFAMCALLGGFFEINPIWVYGPYDPWTVASPAQPDWYVAWLDGALRVGPPVALHVWGHTIPSPFWPAIVMPAFLFGGLYAWPWIERRFTRDTRQHNLLDMPYDVPWRAAVGVTVLAFGTILGFVGSDDIQAKVLHVDVIALAWFYRFAVVVVPIVCGLLAFAIARELKARFASDEGDDKKRRAVIVRNAEGGYDDKRRSTPA